MCFSATASFVASGGLAVIGVETLRLASKKQRAVAAIPVIFAIHQALEGVQWLALGDGGVNSCAAYSFISIALVMWPVYLPAVIYSIDKKRRKILQWPLVVGILLALYYAALLKTQPLEVRVVGHSIYYKINMLYGPITGILYLFATGGSMLMSSNRAVRLFGVSAFASVMIAALFFAQTFASTWCFFAAILSSLIYVYIRQSKKTKRR